MSSSLPKTSFRFIQYFIAQQKIKFGIAILIAVLWAVNEAIFPYFLKRIVDILQHYQGDLGDIYSAVGGTVSLLIIFWAATEFFLRTQNIILRCYAFPAFRASIRKQVFDYVKSHSHEYFSSHFSGNIAKKLSDLPTSCEVIAEIVLLQFITAASGLLIIFVMMWVKQPMFAMILLIWFVLHMGMSFLFLRRGHVLAEIHSDAVTTLSGKIVDVFSNILNMRLFARANYEADYLKKFQNDELRKSYHAAWVLEWMRLGQALVGLFLIFGIIFALIHAWTLGQVTLGDFTQIGMQAFWVLNWVWFISFQLTVLTRELGVISSGLTLIKKGHDLVDVEDAQPLMVRQGELQFENVSFHYHKNRPVFQNLNVMIPAGQKVGLVGLSGSGKSTFVNLILRFYDLQSGRILIDGQDIASVQQDSLREQIAMIPQDTSLFHRSLMENIRYGRLEATDEEVIAASKLAHCHEFIEKLDEGYHSSVGERGVKLSGGQRQRIAIARAILKNAPILLLDEATSALDSVTEKFIQESLHTLMQGRTTIVIAHRLSTLADMDRILVFDKGKIIEEGSHENLLAANGCFAKLWAMQSDGFLRDE